jgi:DNA-binding MarR family transcriptional regulator
MPESRRSNVGASARLATRLAKHIELVLGSIDLTPSQYLALARLSEGPAGASRLAASVAISRPSTTALVDSLVARGLVDRHDDPDDRRRVALSLTEEGHRTLEHADETVETRFAEILDYTPGAVAEQALEGLRSWQEPLDRYRADHLQGDGR